MKHSRYYLPLLLLLTLTSVSLLAERAPTVRQRSLVELTQKSETIVHGTVIAAAVEQHPALPHLATVVVKLRVADTLKGSADETFTFREFLWKPRASQRDIPPHYQPGQELVLLMLPTSRYNLSSPAGMEQGVFRVTRDKSGQAFAVNGRNNRNLFVGTTQALATRSVKMATSTASAVRNNTPGPVRLDDLSNIIRQLVEAGNAN